MKDLNIQAIKDRIARGRLQGGNPTGGEEGPFHLYHLALDDLDALILYVESPAERIRQMVRPGTIPIAAPRVAENLSDEERAELLKVAEEHKG